MSKDTYSSEEMKRYFNDPEFRRKRARRSRSLTPRQLVIAFASIALVVLLSTWYTVYVLKGLPSLEQLENPRPELSTKIYSVDGEILDQFFYKNRSRVTLDKLPPGLIPALVATEDKEFYNHWGLHVTRIFKAFIKNIIAFDLDREGASTITQQLSRNLYLKVTDKNIFDKFTRKIREAFTSVQIERNFTKNEILELYLNVALFGRGAYGIESASRTYFGKNASELSVGEYTLLIGMLKGPGYYDPINHPERALDRRDIVLGQMRREGLISRDSIDIVRADSIRILSMETDFRAGIAPHYVEMIRQLLLKKAEQYGTQRLHDPRQPDAAPRQSGRRRTSSLLPGDLRFDLDLGCTRRHPSKQPRKEHPRKRWIPKVAE
jgi:penicillin-binding protein 1A